MILKFTKNTTENIINLIINDTINLYNTYSESDKEIINNFINIIKNISKSNFIAIDIIDNINITFEYDSENILDYYVEIINYNNLTIEDQTIFDLFKNNIIKI